MNNPAEQENIAIDIPRILKMKLLEDAAVPNEYHITRSHPCALHKMGTKDEGQWRCSRAKQEGKQCLSEMMKLSKEELNLVEGWKCEKDEEC